MKTKFLVVIFILQSFIFFGFLITNPIQSQNSIQDEATTSILAKTSTTEYYKRVVDEFLVNNYTNGPQQDASICKLSEEKIAVAWESQNQGESGGAYNVFTSVFDTTTGENITAEFRANYFTSNDQVNPSICALSDDVIAVAWQSQNQDAGTSGVYVRVFDATTGENITSEFRANYYTSNNQENPSICALSNDTIAVAWQSDGQDGDEYGIYARVFNATTGENITAEFRANYYITKSQLNPSICALSNDTIAVAWQSDGQDIPTSYGIYARIFNATTGENVTSEFRANYFISNDQVNPSICALSNDAIAVAWRSTNQGEVSAYNVYARVFNATTGENITSEFRANYYTPYSQMDPSICAFSSSKLAVSWYGMGQDTPGSYAIYTRIFDANTGNSLTSDILINYNISNLALSPSICALNNDRFAVAWQSDNQVPDNSGNGVFATVFGPKIIIPSNGGDDDDDDDGEKGGIPGYDVSILIIGIALISVVIILSRWKLMDFFKN
jgi:hypothetical protein